MGANNQLTDKFINTIRGLSMDSIQKANSGHPGAPLGLAPVGWMLYDRVMKYNPAQPDWINRDRFILSAGHASMLVYSLLHLCGFDLPLEELKNFRQWGSRCAGHPEYRMVDGIEMTTGPLGQGAATSVGMALAERWFATRYNKPNFDIFDYKTYAVMGDGCMMEGLTSEAASIAGNWGLDKLVWIYDSNRITIEGDTDITFTEDVAKRFEAYGWQVLDAPDANDVGHLEQLIKQAGEKDKPTLVIVHSHIAYGSPNLQDSANSHGAPLGDEEVALTKKALGLDSTQFFQIDDELIAYRKEILDRSKSWQSEWDTLFESYKKEFKEEAAEIALIQSGGLPAGWSDSIPFYEPSLKGVATRSSGGEVLNAVANAVPWLVGGSADLGPSNKTIIKNGAWFAKGHFDARNIHYGVREHAMGAIANGLALSGLRSYCSTFLVFSDYMRSSIRLAAIMQLPVLFIYTHDSIYVGEDGPTHQPIEHIASLRVMPGVDVIRPADSNELAVLYKWFFGNADRPATFMLSRQDLPTFDRNQLMPADNAVRGGYILSDSAEKPDLIMIASGSEVHLCVEAAKNLEQAGYGIRVVSMPSVEIFERQSEEWKEKVLPKSIPNRMVVEAGTSFGWHKYLPAWNKDAIITRDEFGESAPGDVVAKQFGFSVENIVEKAKKILS